MYKRKKRDHLRTCNLYDTCNLIFLIAAAIIVTSLFEKDSIWKDLVSSEVSKLQLV